MPDLRMPDLNKCEFAGNLTRDPELKYLPSGRPLCEFSVAVSERFKGKDGQAKEHTTFINCTAWDQRAEWIGQKLKKGAPVLVDGKLRMESWDDKQTGQKRTILKVMAFRVQSMAWDDAAGGNRSGGINRQEGYQNRPAPRPIEEPIPEDDIPF